MIETFGDIIDQWESAADLARDLGLKEVTVRAWRNRGTIPAAYWPEIEEKAASRKFEGVTVRAMAALAASGAGREQTPTPPRSDAA